MNKLLICVLLSIIVFVSSTPLDDYVNAPDPTYKWTLNNTIVDATFTTYIIELTSQTWMTEAESNWPVWKHWVSVCVPNTVRTNTAFLYIDGKSNNNWETPTSTDGTIELACIASESVVVGVTQIPNQPIIFNNDGVPRFEDDLIAYTWRHFLNDTSDPTWLARLPMTKAIVKAMDCVQEFGKTLPLNVENFVVAGASKRGWTTWTTGAVDSRVIAIVPIVMPILNMIPNMNHGWQDYGAWSFALNDYTGEGVMNYLNSPQMKELAAIVDPYSYIERLTMPKYAVCSTGDEFFLPDSPSFFWDNLIGEKHLRLVPNAEHSLAGHQTDILLSIVTFLRLVTSDTPRPTFTWNITYTPDGNTATIDMFVPAGSMLPTKVKVWDAITESETRRDFRLLICQDPEACVQFVIWVPKDITPQGTTYSYTMSKPNVGWRGFFLEASYDLAEGVNDEYTLKFTSEVAIIPNTLPYPPFNATVPTW